MKRHDCFVPLSREHHDGLLLAVIPDWIEAREVGDEFQITVTVRDQHQPVMLLVRPALHEPPGHRDPQLQGHVEPGEHLAALSPASR